MKINKQENISFELLADYVEGLLDQASMQRIDQLIDQDEYYQNIIEGIRYYYQEYGEDRSQLEQYLFDFQSRIQQKTLGGATRRRLISQRILSIAALALVLVTCFFIFQNVFSSKNAGDLMAQALEQPYGSIYDVNKSQHTADSIRIAVHDLYQEARYQDAATILESLSQIERTTEDYFMLSMSYLYQNPPRYSQAVGALKQAQNQPNNEAFIGQIQWYLAISYYKDGQRSKAEELFANIAGNEGHYNQKKAQQILESW